MLVEIAVILQEKIEEALCIVKELSTAVEEGQIKKVDISLNTLRNIVNKKYLVFITEDNWLSLIKEVRKFKPEFETSYLLAHNQLEDLLGLELSEEYTDILNIAKEAISEKSLMLQLPIWEEDTFV